VPDENKNSSFDTLKSNVWSRVIACFLAPPLALIILFAFAQEPAELFVFLFACVVFLWALTYPGIAGELPNTAVDFWYYTLGLGSVVLFFIVNSAERSKLSLKDTISSSAVAIETLSTQKKLLLETQAQEAQASSQIKGRESDVIAQVQAYARERAKQNETLLSGCGNALMRSRFEGSRPKQWGLDPSRSSPTAVDLSIDMEKAMCDAAILNNYWDKLARITNIQELYAAIKKHSIGDSFTVSINGANLGVGTAARYLAVPPDSEAAKKEVAQIDSRIGTAELKREEARRALSKRDESEEISVRDRFARLGYFLWPYVLITALGMKLARRPYLYKSC
jgi:hypothetical protein